MMRFMTRERDWEKLGRTYAAARKAAGLSQVEVAEQLHVSRTAVQAIERGRQSSGTFTKVSANMRAYARLLGWTEDSPERILDGQPPEQATQPVSAADNRAPDAPTAIDRELRTGKTLDHAVVHLGANENDDTRLIVVLQGAEDMTEEEIDAAWQKWRQTRRRLQAIPGESDTPREP